MLSSDDSSSPTTSTSPRGVQAAPFKSAAYEGRLWVPGHIEDIKHAVAIWNTIHPCRVSPPRGSAS
eukprot:1116656-Prorocentrum_minimum.AAC.1